MSQTLSIKVLVRDAVTREGIPGARVYVDSQPAAVTATDGRVTLTENVVHPPHRLTVVSDAEYEKFGPVTVSVLPDTIDLQPKPPYKRVLTVVVEPRTEDPAQTAGAAVTISEDGQVLDAGHVADNQGQMLTGQGFADGVYSIHIEKEGFEPIDQEFQVVRGNDTYAFQMVSLSSDPAIDQPKPAEAPVSPETLQGSSLVEVVDAELDYDWVYPNSVDGKYFTTTQARMYIGNLFIDEFNSLQFTYHRNRIPIYGYSSEDADAFGKGKRLVQGQILINFISEGYLYTVLKEHKRLLDQALTNQQDAQQESLNQLALERAKLIALRNAGNSDNDFTKIDAALQANQAKTNQMAAQLGADSIDKARKALKDAERLTTNKNAIVLNIPFDVVVELEGAGRTVTKRLEHCLLTSNEQLYDQSGTPVLDCYGFIARRVN